MFDTSPRIHVIKDELAIRQFLRASLIGNGQAKTSDANPR